MEDLTEKAIESHQETIKAEEDTYKAELEVFIIFHISFLFFSFIPVLLFILLFLIKSNR